MLPFIVSGIATGAIYGLALTGLVLMHKTSGSLNVDRGSHNHSDVHLLDWTSTEPRRQPAGCAGNSWMIILGRA